MKIDIAAYDITWPDSFAQIKSELNRILNSFSPIIEHIGSTSVPKLAAKPVIDVAVGLNDLRDLDGTIQPMLSNHFIYYEVYNTGMPERRLFVGLKDKKDHSLFPNTFSEGDEIPHELINVHRHCNIHIWKHGSSEWNRHIAFREYLRQHPSVRDQYGKLKEELSIQNWKDVNEYNDGKNDFIQKIQSQAVEWYLIFNDDD